MFGFWGSGRRGSHDRRLMVASCAVLVTLCTAGSAAAATALAESFESTSLRSWSTTSNVTIGQSYAKSGSYGARVVSTSHDPGYLNWSESVITQGSRYARIGGWVRITSCDCAQNVPVLTVKNANGYNHFDIWREGTTGQFRYDLYRGNSARSTMPSTVGQWYFVEALIEFGGTYTAKVRINGINQPTITSTAQVGTTVKSGWFGGPTTGLANTKHYDDLALAVASSPYGFTR